MNSTQVLFEYTIGVGFASKYTNLITSSHLRLRQIWYNMTYGDIDFDKKDQHLDKRKFQVIWRMVMMMLMMIIKDVHCTLKRRDHCRTLRTITVLLVN